MPNHPNPSFEDAGASPGEADSWTIVITFGGYLIADFGEGGIPKDVEDFEGALWGTSPYLYVVATGLVATFDSLVAPTPSTAETFSRWSQNASYVTIVSTGLAAVFDGGEAETFGGAGWGLSPYFTEVSDDVGNASPINLETFEDPGWTGTYYDTVEVGINGVAAMFDNGTSAVEDFEEVVPDLLFIVDDAATGLLAVPTGTHDKANGDKVTTLSTGVRPSGLAANVVYYVAVVSPSTFRLSKTNGGPAVTFGDLGSGSHYLHADETIYWCPKE